jgi:hypothetical protein
VAFAAAKAFAPAGDPFSFERLGDACRNGERILDSVPDVCLVSALARANHAASLLADGSVLVVGGAGGQGGDVSVASAEVFDPRQGSWTSVGGLAQARTGHTATVLGDGRVLVAGGESAARGARRSLNSAEVYDPRAREWRSAGDMRCPRSEQAAALLRDGTVLVVAGDAAFPGKAPIAQSCTDRYQP